MTAAVSIAIPLPWKCSRPDWIGLWETWSGARCPCPWQAGWDKMTFQVPSNLSHSMISSQMSGEKTNTCQPDHLKQVCSSQNAKTLVKPLRLGSTTLIFAFGNRSRPKLVGKSHLVRSNRKVYFRNTKNCILIFPFKIKCSNIPESNEAYFVKSKYFAVFTQRHTSLAVPCSHRTPECHQALIWKRGQKCFQGNIARNTAQNREPDICATTHTQQRSRLIRYNSVLNGPKNTSLDRQGNTALPCSTFSILF